jgi:hypothetical protein
MSKQQTAVEWLWNQIKSNNINSYHEIVDLFNRAKQMEKEQVIYAFNEGMDFSADYCIPPYNVPESDVYYKQTYGDNNE